MRLRSLVCTLVAAGGLGGCLLEPLVDDGDQISINILPAGSVVPRVDVDPELVHQIAVHDGLDDQALYDAGSVIVRKTGWAAGVEVKYWSFGPAPRIGAPVYVLVDASGARVDHPYLLDTIPGDPGYSAIRRLINVTVSDRYAGERLPTLAALADAVELGLVYEPLTTGLWVNMPVVLPGILLEVGGGVAPASSFEVFAGGHRVDAFILGGARGVQPLRSGALPVGQASLLREGLSAAFLDKPVFQYAPPAAPPTMGFNYTPLCFRIELRLAPGVVAATQIHGDADLFSRSMTGAIRAQTALVSSYEITERVENWPLQFVEGEP